MKSLGVLFCPYPDFHCSKTKPRWRGDQQWDAHFLHGLLLPPRLRWRPVLPTCPKYAPLPLYIWHKSTCEHQDLNCGTRVVIRQMQCTQGGEYISSLKSIRREAQTNYNTVNMYWMATIPMDTSPYPKNPTPLPFISWNMVLPFRHCWFTYNIHKMLIEKTYFSLRVNSAGYAVQSTTLVICK